MGVTNWRTPPETFDPLHDEFRFTLDAAASHENALLPNYCTPEGQWITMHGEEGEERIQITIRDGLHATWDMERVWCNPPYSPAPVLYAFVEKCANHAKAGGLAVMLLNASTTDTRWWHKFIWDCKLHRPRERVEVRFLPKRIAFLDDNGVAQKSPRYSNQIVVFHPHEVAA